MAACLPPPEPATTSAVRRRAMQEEPYVPAAADADAWAACLFAVDLIPMKGTSLAADKASSDENPVTEAEPGSAGAGKAKDAGCAVM